MFGIFNFFVCWRYENMLWEKGLQWNLVGFFRAEKIVLLHTVKKRIFLACGKFGILKDLPHVFASLLLGSSSTFGSGISRVPIQRSRITDAESSSLRNRKCSLLPSFRFLFDWWKIFDSLDKFERVVNCSVSPMFLEISFGFEILLPKK